MPLTGKEELPVSKLKALVNHLPGAIYRCRADENLTLEFFSDEVVNLTGYPIRYFLNDKTGGYTKLIHSEDLAHCKAKTRDAIAAKEKYEIEYRIVRKDGSVRWVLETGQGVYDESEEISYIDGCIFDITQRKQTESALSQVRDEVKTLALVVHNTTNSVMIANAEERITWVNDGYTRISGYTAEEIKGKKIGFSLEGPGFDREIASRISSALANRTPYKETFISHKKNGEQIWLEVDCQPLQDEDGNHLGFMSIENDISDRKRTLQDMEELLQRLTLATNSAEIGIFEIDLSTRVVIWDDRMYTLYGYTRDTPLSLYKIFRKAIHPDDAGMVDRIIGDLLSQKKEINGAMYRILLPNGSIRYIESHAIIKKSESGRIISLIGTNRDITEDVLVQEKIKMQNKILRDIAFIQSHEVRKPLANILGILEILQQNPEIKELEIFDHLSESARELDQQIRDIVDKSNNMDDELFR